MYKYVMGWLVATLLLLILGMGCRKDIIVDDTAIPVVDSLNKESKHTDSLLRAGKLKVGDPSYITRHPGDDHTYDIYYGRTDSKEYSATSKEYILNNKWVITYLEMKNERGTILFWHNAKTVMLTNLTPGEFLKFTHYQIIKGTDLIKLLDEERN